MSEQTKNTKPNSPKYVGPYYNQGIVLPTGKKVKPKDMNAEERKALIKEYPPAEKWFS